VSDQPEHTPGFQAQRAESQAELQWNAGRWAVSSVKEKPFAPQTLEILYCGEDFSTVRYIRVLN